MGGYVHDPACRTVRFQDGFGRRVANKQFCVRQNPAQGFNFLENQRGLRVGDPQDQ